MKKLFLLIPATLIFNMTIAQDTKSEMTQKSASLDGKSFKITMTSAGNQGMNTESGDKMNASPDNRAGDMRNHDGTSMDKSKGSTQAQTGTDKNGSGKTATLKFKNGMIKSSFLGMTKGQACSYTTTTSASSADAISFTSNCSNDNRGTDKSLDNTGDKSNGTTGTTDPSSNTTTGTTSNMSQVEWTGTVTGNNINGTLKVMENGQNNNYSFTGTITETSGELGMGE